MQLPLPVSAIVPTLNEEAAIVACLAPLIGVFAEVFVVDSGSADRTTELAIAAGATVVNYSWDGKYPKKKQWCLDNLPLTTDWVLFVDADEIVPHDMVVEMSTLQLTNTSTAAFDVPLEYWWRGRRLKHGQTVTKRSLLNRHKCRFPVVDDLKAPGMGEQEGHYQPILDEGLPGKLASYMEHRDPDPLRDWFARHNRYSDWESYLRADPDLRRAIAKFRTRSGRRLERLPAKALAVFFYNFIFQQGWRDGRPGFEYAACLAFYQFMISIKVREQLDARTRGAFSDV